MYLMKTQIASYCAFCSAFLSQLKWTEPNEEELVKFMCEEKGFRFVMYSV